MIHEPPTESNPSQYQQVNTSSLCWQKRQLGFCRNSQSCQHQHALPGTPTRTLLLNGFYSPSSTEVALLEGKKPPSSGLPIPKYLYDSVVLAFDVFYRNLYMECLRFGEVKGVYFVENLDPLVRGHTYVVFQREEAAIFAAEDFRNRRVDGREIKPEFVEAFDFEKEVCQLAQMSKCIGSFSSQS